MGQPQGRLKWIRHTANHLDIPVKVGSYGDDTLQLTMTVNSTYDCDLLRCDVDWVTDIAGPFYALTVRGECSQLVIRIYITEPFH